MNPTEELNRVIQEGRDMATLMKDDTFKSFYERVTKELRINLVGAYNTPDEKKRKAIQDQIIFSAGLENYCVGTIQAGDMAEAQLEEYTQSLEEGE